MLVSMQHSYGGTYPIFIQHQLSRSARQSNPRVVFGKQYFANADVNVSVNGFSLDRRI